MASLEDASDDEGLLASINIIPFVDIVLVLLVIFMLTSATIIRASLKVELPKAASAGSRVESTLNLVYSKDEKLAIDGQPVSSMRDDKGVAYGRVVELIDLVKANGITTFALDVERGPSPTGAATGGANP
jgi:biopolymer transport protein ExbD